MNRYVTMLLSHSNNPAAATGIPRRQALKRSKGTPGEGMTPEHLFVIVAYVSIVIMSIVLHEVAHGWVAYRCGDDTAYLMGRLTLNPLKHVDLFMTILLPAMCIYMGFPAFGGAKPVPVNPYRLRRPGIDDRLVSAAGVAANLAIVDAGLVTLTFGNASAVDREAGAGDPTPRTGLRRDDRAHAGDRV